jgi:hypothetical protein
MGEAAFKTRCCQDIKSAILAKEFNLKRLTHHSSLMNAEADEVEDEEAIMKRKEVGSLYEYEIKKVKKIVQSLVTSVSNRCHEGLDRGKESCHWPCNPVSPHHFQLWH